MDTFVNISIGTCELENTIREVSHYFTSLNIKSWDLGDDDAKRAWHARRAGRTEVRTHHECESTQSDSYANKCRKPLWVG